MRSWLLASVPALALALLTFWSGTLFGGASFSGAATTHIALLGLAALAAPAWRDPLALGWHGRLLPAALLVSLSLSWWLSPVERAGRVGLVLLPAMLLVPAAVARCWRQPRSRALGLLAMSVVTGAAALVSIVWMLWLDSARAALPLGHHNLLAAWLVILWPVAVLPGRQTPLARWLAWSAGALAAVALLASGSLVAALALAAQAVLVARWWPRTRLLIAGLCLLALVSQAPRAASLISGSDPSFRARMTYLAAGWRGSLARPVFGWGPGSVPWTVSRFLEPRPGVNPASEIVGDLHCMPLQVTYELGLPGLLLSLATLGLFARRRLVETRTAAEPELLRAGLVGLAGGGVLALGSSALSVAAVPFAVAVVAGTTLSASMAQDRFASRSGRTVTAIYLGVAALVLLPLDRAHHRYQKARELGMTRASLEHLEKATAIDPAYPLYRARRAWLATRLGESPPGASIDALRAARDAVAVAPLWLAAGTVAADLGQPWARSALETASRLDPLSPLAAYHVMRAQPDHPEAPDWGARALRAEPRLAAASFWAHHHQLRHKVIEQLTPGSTARRRLESVGGKAAGDSQSGVSLALTLDTEAAVSFSLYAFRRSPWPAALAPVELDRRLQAELR